MLTISELHTLGKTAIVAITLSFAVMVLNHAAFDGDAIVGMWDFDEGKGKVVKDLSGNGTDGELVGDLKWAKGKFGTGLEFNGVDTWVKLGTKGEDKTLAALDFKDSKGFSINAWVYAAEEPTGKCIIWKGLGCSTWSQYLLGTGAHENGQNRRKPRFISVLPTVEENSKSSAMNSGLKSGYTSSAHGTDPNCMSTLMINYRTPKMPRAHRGHLLKKSISVRTRAAANAVSGKVLLTKLLSLTRHSLMTTS